MHRILVFTPLLLLAVPFAGAQDGCTQTDPCPIAIDLDENGISEAGDGDPRWNVTLGDWYTIDFLNLDEQEHTVALDGYGLSWQVPAVDGLTTDPFAFDQEGTFHFGDAPSGDTALVTVLANDAVAVEEGEEDAITDAEDPGADEDGRRSPGPSVVLLLALLGVALWLHRR